MPQYTALLRGINVGGHRVKMDRLRSLFEDLGFNDVSTLIASGNVIFSDGSEDPEALRETIERHLAQELGYVVATFLRTPAQLVAIASVDPPTGAVEGRSPTSHYVIFLHHAASDSLRSRLAGLGSEIDHFECLDTEVHWGIQGKLTDSPLFAGGLDRALGVAPTTMRNINTLRRIVAKTETPDAI